MIDAVPPPPAPPPAPPQPAGLPWERRRETGAVTALAATFRILLAEPVAGFATARRAGDLGSPISWAVLLGWLGFAANIGWTMLANVNPLAWLPTAASSRSLPEMAMTGVVFAAVVVVLPLLVLVGLFLQSALVHLFLLLYGGIRQSETGFEGTLRAISWSATAQMALLVPLVGGLVAAVWGVCLQVLALVSFHRTSAGRALAAVLTPLVLCCVCIFFFFAGAAALAVLGLAGAGG